MSTAQAVRFRNRISARPRTSAEARADLESSLQQATRRQGRAKNGLLLASYLTARDHLLGAQASNPVAARLIGQLDPSDRAAYVAALTSILASHGQAPLAARLSSIQSTQQAQVTYIRAMLEGLGVPASVARERVADLFSRRAQYNHINPLVEYWDQDPGSRSAIERLGASLLAGSDRTSLQFPVGSFALQLLRSEPSSGYFTNLDSWIGYWEGDVDKFNQVIQNVTEGASVKAAVVEPVKVEFVVGQSIQGAVRELIEAATSAGRPAVGRFSDLELTAVPGDHPDRVIAPFESAARAAKERYEATLKEEALARAARLDGVELIRESPAGLQFHPEGHLSASSWWSAVPKGGIDLITPTQLAQVPDRTVLRSISGEELVVGYDDIDGDTRGGFLAYGFPTPRLGRASSAEALAELRGGLSSTMALPRSRRHGFLESSYINARNALSDGPNHNPSTHRFLSALNAADRSLYLDELGAALAANGRVDEARVLGGLKPAHS